MMFNKKEKKELTLDEKVDKILKFQKSMRIWAIVRAISSFAFFFVFIILPILGIIYFGQWLKDTTGFDMVGMQESLVNLQKFGQVQEGANVDVDEISKGIEDVLQRMGLGGVEAGGELPSLPSN